MERRERLGPGLAAAGRRPRRRGDEFRALLREAARDPVVAAELTAGYAGLPPRERQALRTAAEEDAARLGFDVERILACWRTLEPRPSARPAWRAWIHGERVVLTAPGRGAVEVVPGAGVRLHRDGWTPGPDHCPMEVEEAVDRFASMLWSARREGRPWPRQLGAFADLFDR